MTPHDEEQARSTVQPGGAPYCVACGTRFDPAAVLDRCPGCGRPVIEVLIRDRSPTPWRRYVSPRRLFGLPLLVIVSGLRGSEHPSSPVGILAMGDRPRGLIALGGLPLGVIAIGGAARGVIAIGGCALGVVSFGGLTLGVAAFGGIAVGIWAFGGVVLGLLAAHGAMIHTVYASR
jgi:hypothetical protein